MAFGAVKSYIISWKVNGMLEDNVNVFWANDSLFRIGCKWRDAEEFLNEAITGDKSAPQDSIWTLIPDGSITQSTEYEFEFDFPSMAEYNNSKPVIIKRVDEASNNITYYVCRTPELISQQSGEGYTYHLHMIKDYNLTFGIRLMYAIKNAKEIKDKEVFVQQGHPTLFYQKPMQKITGQYYPDGEPIFVEQLGVVLDWEKQKYLSPQISNIFLYDSYDVSMLNEMWYVWMKNFGEYDEANNQNPWFKYSDFVGGNVYLDNIGVGDPNIFDLTAPEFSWKVSDDDPKKYYQATIKNELWEHGMQTIDTYYQLDNGLYIYNLLDDLGGLNSPWIDTTTKNESDRYRHWLNNDSSIINKITTDIKRDFKAMYNDRNEDSLYLWPEEQSPQWRATKWADRDMYSDSDQTKFSNIDTYFLPKNYKKRLLSPIPPYIMCSGTKVFSTGYDGDCVNIDPNTKNKIPVDVKWGKVISNGALNDTESRITLENLAYNAHLISGEAGRILPDVTLLEGQVGMTSHNLSNYDKWDQIWIVKIDWEKTGIDPTKDKILNEQFSITYHHTHGTSPYTDTRVSTYSSGFNRYFSCDTWNSGLVWNMAWCWVQYVVEIQKDGESTSTFYTLKIGSMAGIETSYLPWPPDVLVHNNKWFPMIPVTNKTLQFPMIQKANDPLNTLSSFVEYYADINDDFKKDGKIPLNVKNCPVLITSSIQQLKMSVFNIDDENSFLSGEIIDPIKLCMFNESGDVTLNYNVNADLTVSFGTSTLYGFSVHNLLYNEEYLHETVLLANVSDDSLSIKDSAYDYYWQNYYDYERASREQLRDSDSIKGLQTMVSGTLGGISQIIGGAAMSSTGFGAAFGTISMIQGGAQIAEGLIVGGLKSAGVDITGNMAIDNKIKELKDSTARQGDVSQVSQTVRPYMYGFFKQTNLKPIIHSVKGHEDINNTIVLKHLFFGWDIQRYIPVKEMMNYDNYSWFKGSLDNLTPFLNNYLANSNLKITGEELQWFINGFNQGRYIVNNTKGELDWNKNYQTEYPIITIQNVNDIFEVQVIFWVKNDPEASWTNLLSHYIDPYADGQTPLDASQLVYVINNGFIYISALPTSTIYSGDVKIKYAELNYLLFSDNDKEEMINILLSGNPTTINDIWNQNKQAAWNQYLAKIGKSANNMPYYNLQYSLTTIDGEHWHMHVEGYPFLVKNDLDVDVVVNLTLLPSSCDDEVSGDDGQICSNGICSELDNDGNPIPFAC